MLKDVEFDEVKVDVLEPGVPLLDQLGAPQTLTRQMLSSGVGPTLRKNSLLSYDQWKQIDGAVVAAARQRMVITQDVLSRGLTYPLDDALGVTVIATQKASDFAPAMMDMNADTETPKDKVDIKIDYLPVPIVHSGFWLSIRDLRSSQRNGTPLDTTLAELAGRVVMEKIEGNFATGTSTYTHGGGSIYGLLDAPNKNSVTVTAHWNDSGADPVADVIAMKQALINDRYYGPYALYVPTAWETALDEDYVSGYPKTVRQRILEIEGVQSVQVCDKLTADYCVMVQMTSDVIRAITGFGGSLYTVEWDTLGGLRVHYKVMGIIVPQVRSDYNSRCGIVVGTK
jgi:hypothetical protein